jgi:hypothetical protein
MIDSTTSIPETAKSQIEYPVMAKHRNTGTIVLFYKEGCGVLLKDFTGCGNIGEHSVLWNPIAMWDILPPGSRVTLEQK